MNKIRDPANPGTARASPSEARTAAQDRQAVLETLAALDAALLSKDASELLSLLEADFVGVVPAGIALSRSAYVVFHTRPSEGLRAIEPAATEEPTVRMFNGRLAVVHRRVSVSRADSSGRSEDFEVQRTEVLRRAAGRWRLVAGQGTRVAPHPPK
jgi:uncharacterized protein (TIGR02246 family)